MLVLLLAAMIFSFNCQGPLAKLCTEVGPKVSALWWKSNATVYVVKDDVCFAEGPYGNAFIVHLCSPNPALLAHELTHVLQIERGLEGPLWLIEGMAELSAYLLYPNLHSPYYEEAWLSRGYGSLNGTIGIYGGGLVIVYSVYEEKGKEGVLSLFNKINYKEVAEILAKRLANCDTPHNLCPSKLREVVSLAPLSWAGSSDASGEVVIYKDVAVAYGKGEARPMSSFGLLVFFALISIHIALKNEGQFLKSPPKRAT